jgi:hypothetical protein
MQGNGLHETGRDFVVFIFKLMFKVEVRFGKESEHGFCSTHIKESRKRKREMMEEMSGIASTIVKKLKVEKSTSAEQQ